MKIVFIGGVKFSYEILSHILKKGWKISACFTYKETKKKIYSDMVSFDDLLSKYHIKHIKVDNINDEKNIKILKKIKPDLILTMGWSQLLKSEIIKIPKLGVIGSHPTELPKFRGRAPIPWSIIKGLKKSALTFFYIEKGIDDGDILDQEKFEITPSDDATTIYQKVISKGKKMIIKNLKLIKNGKVKRKKQNKKKFLEYWNKRIPEDGKIFWEEKANKIHDLIRASTKPYPGAFTFFNKKKLVIWKSKLNNDKNRKLPGKIIDVNHMGVKIGTKKDNIILRTISFGKFKEVNAMQVFTKKDIGKILG